MNNSKNNVSALLPVNLEVGKPSVYEGEYEGNKYYRLVVSVGDSFKATCKLTPFEYKSLKDSVVEVNQE